VLGGLIKVDQSLLERLQIRVIQPGFLCFDRNKLLEGVISAQSLAVLLVYASRSANLQL
jgi:hypothetical protein